MKKPIVAILLLALGMLVFSACGTSGTENAETAAAEETTAPEAKEDDAGKSPIKLPADETAENVDQQKRNFAAPTPRRLVRTRECGHLPRDLRTVRENYMVCVKNCEQCGCTKKIYEYEDGVYTEEWTRKEYVSAVIGWRENPFCRADHCPAGLTGPDAPVIHCDQELPADPPRK